MKGRAYFSSSQAFGRAYDLLLRHGGLTIGVWTPKMLDWCNPYRARRPGYMLTWQSWGRMLDKEEVR